MKIGYIGDSAYRAVIEHSKEITLNINEDTEAVLVESAVMETPPDLPALNTCIGVRALSLNEELRDTFNDVHGLVPGYPATYLYGFIGVEGLSDMLEMTHSTRFLTGDVGPQVSFVQGTGIACRENIFLALPKLGNLVNSLIEIGYKGEIAFGITAGFEICSIVFGHLTLGFALYTELSVHSPQSNYEWCLGRNSGGKLHTTGISVGTLLSYPPFPYPSSQPISVKAPTMAEKHLYRVLYGLDEVAYTASWGEDIHEAKRRVRKTIDNCRNYNKDIQYRIDYGFKERFVLNNDQWLAFGGVEPKQT
jgi:hypothetical protein